MFSDLKLVQSSPKFSVKLFSAILDSISCNATISTFKESIIGNKKSTVDSFFGKFSIFHETMSNVNSEPAKIFCEISLSSNNVQPEKSKIKNIFHLYRVKKLYLN